MEKWKSGKLAKELGVPYKRNNNARGAESRPNFRAFPAVKRPRAGPLSFQHRPLHLQLSLSTPLSPAGASSELPPLPSESLRWRERRGRANSVSVSFELVCEHSAFRSYLHGSDYHAKLQVQRRKLVFGLSGSSRLSLSNSGRDEAERSCSSGAENGRGCARHRRHAQHSNPRDKDSI